MILYADSSAVLSWLLREENGTSVRQSLEAAEFVLVSDLTLVECDRALRRAEHLGQLPSEDRIALASELAQWASHWNRLRLTDEIVSWARGPFPEEPIRSLDALHLASASIARGLIPELVLLTLDERMRRCGRALGFELLPTS